MATAVVALVACSDGTPAQPEFDRRGAPPSALELRVGETKHLYGVSVTFVRVLEDSRCPIDVHCVWAGNGGAEVAVGPVSGRGPTHHLSLNTDLEPREGVAWDLRVRLTALDPAPLSTRPIRPDEYVVHLQVTGVDGGFGPPGLNVTTDALRYPPGAAVELRIANGTEATYWFNACMAPLERLAGAAWVTVELQRACTAIAQQLPARDTVRALYPLERSLADGQYRIPVQLADSVVVRSNVFRIAR